MINDFIKFLESQDCKAVLSEFGIDVVGEFVVHEQERKISPYTIQGKVRSDILYKNIKED